jgi:hypothetical protein
MTKPPFKRVTQQFLDQTYNSQEWQDRLSLCRQEEIDNYPTPITSGQPWGTSTVAIKYWEGDNRIAVVVFYRKPDGSVGASGRPSCKGLLIDGTWHHQ